MADETIVAAWNDDIRRTSPMTTLRRIIFFGHVVTRRHAYHVAHPLVGWKLSIDKSDT
jgi:hypothetical protein